MTRNWHYYSENGPGSANHTPGPWRIGDAGTTVFGPKTERPSPLTIATLTKNDTKANAHLIAAAPELLEALKAITSAFYAVCDDESGVDNDPTYLNARAAIAKAEGK